jgi:hypothetical protein
MSELKPSRDSADPVKYIRGNFDPADRLAVLVLNKRTNSVTQRIAAAKKIMESDFQSWLRYQNDRARSEIYISMNALHPNAPGRMKQDVATIRHIYLDFDVEGTATVERLLKRPDLPKPNYLINTSSDKWQVVWKVNGFGKEQAEQLQRLLAHVSGSDRATTDICRVLRLPGFWNHKYGTPYLVRAQPLASEVYRPDRFPAICHKDRLEEIAEHRSTKPQSRGKLTQSELDWAYAKRALSRGESPAIVADAIANHRRFDKVGPERYAQLTVRKAREALQLDPDRFREQERS